PPRLAETLVIGISQSGRSPDVVAVLEESRRQGALTIALTNDPASALACTAEHHLPLEAGPELAVAASKTYTHQLLGLAMLSAALSGDAARFDEVAAVPGAVARALAAGKALPEGVVPFREASRFVVLGRGFNYATAFEVALKIKETTYVLA